MPRYLVGVQTDASGTTIDVKTDADGPNEAMARVKYQPIFMGKAGIVVDVREAEG